MRHAHHILAPLLALLAALGPGRAAAAAASCTNPGKDGPAASLTGIVNSYYPGVTTAAGSSFVNVGALDASGGRSLTPIGPGDLVLVIQLQDADINPSNSSAYGGSFAGGGQTALNGAGLYEYATVSASYTSGSPIPLSAPLINGYRTAAAGAAGQRTFQVIRVPQYSSAKLTGTALSPLTAAGWNGATGGVLAFDVGGQLDWNSGVVDVTGLGFRGGGGLYLNGGGGGQPVYSSADYATSLSPVVLSLPLAAPANGYHGAKGEGIAGTSKYLFVPQTARSAVNGAGAVVDSGSDYPGGSMARGAPGNAGGGGTDGDNTTNSNQENTGGGGGGGYAIGGLGGYGWTPGTPPGSPTGGLGGDGVPMGTGRLTMGGGGGAGSSNNGTGNPNFAIASSGAPGGGIVLVRAKTIINSGTVNALGVAGNPNVCNDASGGGGGGGAVLIFASGNSGNVGTVSINASGGGGGSNTGNGTGENAVACAAYNNNPHGPGGGGGGGFVALSSISSATIQVSGASGGTTSPSNTSTPPYGSSASPGGYQISTVASTDIPGSTPSPLCFPNFTTVKTTSAAGTVQGGTTSYTITAANAAGYGTATSLKITDTLPANFTLASTAPIAYSGGATQTSVLTPAAGATAPVWGSFSVPGGGSVRITFVVNVAPATALGTYQNPATVTYDDPTRSSAGQTVTPGGTYAGGGYVAGTNYDPSTSTNEDVTVRQPVAVAKSFSPPSAVAGTTIALSIAVTNPNAVALTGAGFADSFPGGMTASGGALTITGTGCSGFLPAFLVAGATSLAQSGGTVPAGTTCTFSANVTVSTSLALTNTLPAGAFTSAQGVINTAAAGATLLARPTITKAFSPAAVPTSTDATLSFVLGNPNAVALTGAAFNDPFPSGLVATGGAVTVAPAACTGFLPAANAGSFALTAGTIPAGGSCTVSFAVRSATAGAYVNSAGGVTTTETQVAGPAPAPAQLGVGRIGIGKAFSPAGIASGGTSTVTLTLTNPTAAAQAGGSFSDTLTGMTAAGGAVITSCSAISPATLTAGATSLTFTGIGIPAAGCTISFAVTSATVGTQSNTTSGVNVPALGTGPASNTATLSVASAPTIVKAFVPATIQLGQSTTLSWTLNNANSIPLTGVAFTDTLNGGLQVANTGAAGGTCPGAGALSFTAGASVVPLSGLTVPQGSCTVTVQVTVPAGGTYTNTVPGATSNEVPTAGPGSNVATLVVVTPATIAKAFATSPIIQGGNSVLSFTLKHANTILLTGASFTDTLVGMAAVGGAVTYAPAGCAGSPATLTAGATALSFTGITIPTGGAGCTVSLAVTSSASGSNANTASGVTSNETPTAGSGSNTAVLGVLYPPLVGKAFSASVILSTSASSTATSLLTFTLSNPNASALTGVAFTDALSQMAIAATGAAGGTCTGASGNSFTAGATSLSFSGITVPSTGTASCTVTVKVSSASVSPPSGWPNTTSGATSAQTPLVAGPVSNTDYLTVLVYATISKAFNPTAVANNTTSTITFTLANPNSVPLTQVSFSDAFPANLLTSNAAQSFIGAIGRGTCTGAIPSGAVAGAQTTSVAFTGISMPPNTTCTVTVDVIGATNRSFSNTASGVTAAETGALAGPASNTATLASGRLLVAKSFSPATIGLGETSLATFVITNPVGNANTIAFTDALPANMKVAAGGSTNGCGAAGTLTAAVNASSISFAGTATDVVASGATCTITVPVTTTAVGSFPNTTGALSWKGPAGSPGAVSNTAVLTVVAKPTIAKVFSPAGVDTWRNSTLVFTLTNPNATAPLTACTFTDTLTGFFVSNPPSLGGTCVGVTSTPPLALNQTSLNFTVPALNPGSCTITLPVTSGVAGSYSNTSSGVKCAQTTSAGAASNTAPVTFNMLPIQVMKGATVQTGTCPTAPAKCYAPPGSAVTYNIGYTNPNPGASLQSIVITDTTPQYTTYQSASCGPLPASITSCTIQAPAVGQPGVVKWTLGGSLDPGLSGTVLLTVTVN